MGVEGLVHVIEVDGGLLTQKRQLRDKDHYRQQLRTLLRSGKT